MGRRLGVVFFQYTECPIDNTWRANGNIQGMTSD